MAAGSTSWQRCGSRRCRDCARHRGASWPAPASVGAIDRPSLVMAKTTARDIAVLLERADQAMYAAIRAGWWWQAPGAALHLDQVLSWMIGSTASNDHLTMPPIATISSGSSRSRSPSRGAASRRRAGAAARCEHQRQLAGLLAGAGEHPTAGRGKRFSTAPAPRPAARLRAPAPARPSRRRAHRAVDSVSAPACSAFRISTGAPPASPACRQTAAL